MTFPNTHCYFSSITGTTETPFEHSDRCLQALFGWARGRSHTKSYSPETVEFPETLRGPVT